MCYFYVQDLANLYIHMSRGHFFHVWGKGMQTPLEIFVSTSDLILLVMKGVHSCLDEGQFLFLKLCVRVKSMHAVINVSYISSKKKQKRKEKKNAPIFSFSFFPPLFSFFSFYINEGVPGVEPLTISSYVVTSQRSQNIIFYVDDFILSYIFFFIQIYIFSPCIT